MRNTEIWLAVANLAILIFACRGALKRRRRSAAAFAVSAGLLIVHLVVEGARWEMIPLYALTLLPAVLLLRSRRTERQEKAGRHRPGIRIAAGAAALLYGSAAVMLPIALPVFKFEPLEGPYRVGTVTYAWTDESRPQVHAQSSGKRRELLVQFWYPADAKASDKPAPYLEHPRAFAEALGRSENIPALLFDSMRLVRSRSIPDAPLSAEKPKYPVVIYSHGNRGWSGQSTFLTEQLASRGYIVVGIEHAGGTNTTVFPDGTIMPFYADAGQTLDNGAFDRLADEVWVPDVKFVLDKLEEVADSGGTSTKANTGEAAGMFAGSLDLERAGIVGYSLGGAAAVQMLLGDERLRAGIDMDGGFYGSLRAPEGIGRPFMLIRADGTFAPDAMSEEQLAAIGASREQYEATVGELLKRQARAAEGGNYVLTLRHADHTSFSDAPLYSPLLSAASGLDALGAHRVIESYAAAFFDKYLKGEPSELPALEANEGTEHTLIKG
ncbi:acetylhydrolase [Saccharibacillus sp. O23]|uniref:alpha/beta hydrolase family protein n=1 Tax=Saccharibacillus sp. O23 TaxID=2009338 RepID=UPI0015C5CC23|nr:acetylhydrolase [Saccharibacillus sp. O23]